MAKKAVKTVEELSKEFHAREALEYARRMLGAAPKVEESTDEPALDLEDESTLEESGEELFNDQPI